MDYIRKQIFLKFFLVSLAAATLVSMGGWYGGFDSLLLFALILGLWIFSNLLFFLLVSRPFGKTLREMKAMLSGKPYRRMFTKKIDEFGVMAHFFNEVSRNLETISGELEEAKRMSSELSLASEIQQNILPKHMPDIPGIQIFGRTRPAAEVGGDSFDIITVTHNTYVYVGDVTGHGAPAALIMMIVNTLLRTLAEVYGSGYDILIHTNRLLKPKIEATRFMTLLLLRWHASEQKLYATGAGHEHLIIFRKQQGRCDVRESGGIALGMLADNSQSIKEESITLEPGDYVILYSDGLVEAKNPRGEIFGLTRLKASLEKLAPFAETPEELFTNLSKEFVNYVESETQADDVTLLCLKRV